MTLETLLLQKTTIPPLSANHIPPLYSTVKTIIYLWRGKQ